jgi:HlyD family secretion protein
MKATLALTQANLKRDDLLIKKNAIAQADYDTAFAACEVAKANVKVGEAAIEQAKATLAQSQINLGYCNITSPVKGTIIDRRVNVGQTVVSNLSASSMFLLAKDLSRLQVWASVNEADIGRIQPGVKVHFTVDAYPNETFIGEVQQVRLNATMTQNVVTYTVVVTTENKEIELPPDKAASRDLPSSTGPRYKLLPYMTANLLFEIERHEDVLKVPNAALRWKPRPQQIAPDVRAETVAAMTRHDEKSKPGDHKKAKGSGESAVGSGQKSAEQPSQDSKLATSAGAATGLSPQDRKARSEKNAVEKGKTAAPAANETKFAGGGGQPPGQPISPETAAALKEHHESSRLWIVDGNFVRPVKVKIIATDGTMTEVRGQDVIEGMDIVIGESVVNEADSGDTTNPFMPKLFKGNPNSKSSGSSKK